VPSEGRSPRLAVLIDADNASAKIADGLFEEIAKIGEASVRRIYGDFSNPRAKAWAGFHLKTYIFLAHGEGIAFVDIGWVPRQLAHRLQRSRNNGNHFQ